MVVVYVLTGFCDQARTFWYGAVKDIKCGRSGHRPAARRYQDAVKIPPIIARNPWANDASPARSSASMSASTP